MLPNFAMKAGNILGSSAREPMANPVRPVSGLRMSVPRSFKKGGKVKKGGVAKVHKGEKIVSGKQYSAAKAVLASGKKSTKKNRLVEAAGHEMKQNPPKILAKTAAKSGAKQAGKQRVAIMLSKARAAGAAIPEKK